ncbi:lysozyme inhibitor LprI family protein [Achromobacter sp. UBA2119]|uniref:lysozyme inhibitor LprI family protein n=1 Tax=Achromobacter sp. UBA2119 TaxID=1945911 RepID=UPI002580787F|nr:lysozyme inhibitor LprI family protein [Achromobacter sp. UBA2119]
MLSSDEAAPASKPENELRILVYGSVLEVEAIAGNDKWVTVKRIFKGGIATKPAGTQIDNRDTTGFVFLREPDALRAPASFDRIETPSPPIPLNLGDLIGHMGEQVSSGEALIAGQPTSRPTLHLEVFSGEDVPRFLRDCRKHADKLPERHWTLLRLRQDDQIRGEPNDSAPVAVTMGSDWTIAVTRETSLQNECAKTERAEADTLLNEAYRRLGDRINTQYKSHNDLEKTRRIDVMQAQNSWIRLRDADCNLEAFFRDRIPDFRDNNQSLCCGEVIFSIDVFRPAFQIKAR